MPTPDISLQNSPSGCDDSQTRRLKCRIDPEQSPYACMLPKHKPVRRGRNMIDLLAGGGAEAELVLEWLEKHMT